MTRASDTLIIVQDKNKNPLRTIMLNDLYFDCNVSGLQEKVNIKKSSDNKRQVTDLIKHRTLDCMMMMSTLIYSENLNPVTEVYTAENIIKFNSYLEDINTFVCRIFNVRIDKFKYI